jgi:hypothetical protein
VWGKGTKLGEGGKAKLDEWEGTMLGEGCPKVRLTKDRMLILPPHLAYSEGKGTKLGEGESIGILSWLNLTIWVSLSQKQKSSRLVSSLQLGQLKS